ncbi:MAG: protein kinase [Chitinivibrionales bacterium]|nr:protein kinase [Chitinivibrionales bacterium]
MNADHTFAEPSCQDDSFPEPFSDIDLSRSPCNWRQGEYPALDDVYAWLYLSLMCDALYASNQPAPEIPEAVYAFRMGEFADLLHARDMHGARVFFSLYGTVDLFEAAKEKWLHMLSSTYAILGEGWIQANFPSGTRPPRIRSHSNPKINAMLKSFGTKDAEPSIVVADHRKEPSLPHQEDFTVSKTIIETGPSPASPQPADSRRSIDDSKEAQLLKPRELPSTYDTVPMGSGTSNGIIGRGGMAVVYKVRNAVLEVSRAGKVLDIPKLCSTEEEAANLIRRYEMEAKISAQLLHSNIVPVHLYTEFRGLPYIEMEFIDGLDLKKLIAEAGPLPAELITSIGILAARGLSHAHKQEYTLYGKGYSGIMHRDIKPANILLSRKKGDVKLSDFGIARPMEVSVNTLANNTVGTLPYMSPEQIETSNVDTRTDIYSLGATLYEMTTGRQLFPQQNMMDLMKHRQLNKYKPVTELRKDLPRGLASLVDQCLKINLDQRIQHSETLEDFLEDVHRRVTKEKPDSVAQDYLMNDAGFSRTMMTKGGSAKSLLAKLFGPGRG